MNTIARSVDAIPDVPSGAAMHALAYVGDLSMGQPGNHSVRAASIASFIARDLGMDDPEIADVWSVAMLRWSGCTANAAEFSDLLGDDVDGREAMLSLRLGTPGRPLVPSKFFDTLPELGRIHCDVATQVGHALGLNVSVRAALGRLFDPVSSSLPASVPVVVLAGDIEIFSRVYGLRAAAALLKERAGSLYPRSLVSQTLARMPDWLALLDEAGRTDATTARNERVSLGVVGDVVDLKMPCMTGHSRRVSHVAALCAAAFGLGDDKVTSLKCAGMLHGIGRASVANVVWQTPGPLSAAAWEQVRLVPYWTAAAGRQVPVLEREAALASHAFERADGTGYFRGTVSTVTSVEYSILQVANAWVALRSPRPWRAAMSDDAAADLLLSEARIGRFDPVVVNAVVHTSAPGRAPIHAQGPAALSARETEILRAISLGESSKSVARLLSISPSTVRTHVESIFRKLDCSTRAAATLKATQLGLL